MHSTCQLRKFLLDNLDNLSSSLKWLDICQFYSIDLDIIREFRDYVNWQVLYDYSIFDKLDFPLDALREFREEMNWEEGAYKKWVDEITLRGYKRMHEKE